MFCEKCGCEINKAAKFCSNCGKGIDVSLKKRNYSYELSQNGEIKRDALKSYLQDIRALECMKNKLEEDIADLTKESERLAVGRIIDKASRGKYVFWGAIGLSVALYLLFGIIYFLIPNDWFSHWEEAVASFGYTLIAIVMSIGIILGILLYFIDSSKYENDLSLEEERVRNERSEKNKIIKKLKDAKNDLESVNDFLEKMYSINIIPAQFRDIYAACFVCEYIETSNESLSGAFLHFDLELIKTKIDMMLKNQRRIIINQEIQKVQNDVIIAQQNKRLRNYAQMFSSNSKEYNRMLDYSNEFYEWLPNSRYIY